MKVDWKRFWIYQAQVVVYTVTYGLILIGLFKLFGVK